MGAPVMLKKLADITAAQASLFIAQTLRPRYVPPCLLPDSEAAANRLNNDCKHAAQEGYAVTRQLVVDGLVKQSGKRDRTAATLSFEDIQANIDKVNQDFLALAQQADPDALAAQLADLYCVGVEGMAELDNRRRVVATWSAILGPSVVMREFAGRAITIDTVLDAGADWLRYGYTRDAIDAASERSTRFICAHPARMYQLALDSAALANLDHEQLMRSLLNPLMLAISQHKGAMQAIQDIARERRPS